MLCTVTNKGDSAQFEHERGPLEFGRGPQREAERFVLDDPYVSRDQLRVEELPYGTLSVANLSGRISVRLETGEMLAPGENVDQSLPTSVYVGATQIDFCAATLVGVPGAQIERPEVETVSEPRPLRNAPNMETLTRWFETVTAVQQAAVGTQEFYTMAAQAVIDLVGLDRGLVLLREGPRWRVAAMRSLSDHKGRDYSEGILQEVLRCKRTYFQSLRGAAPRESLVDVEAVVAAPVLDAQHEVVGVVYGSRSHATDHEKPVIHTLEAQIVQVLAAAVGIGMARLKEQAEAHQSQVRFEQFFSARLAQALSRDPNLLEGRPREITVMFSDVREYSRISEELGPRETFRLMQDLMELQSANIGRNDGVVVDYFGDGLLAMWNAPTDQPGHAEQACRAALAVMRELPALADQWKQNLETPLSLGIGINTGDALVGNTGSRLKIKYGPMGPTVNLASRIEGATKRLGVPVLISQATQCRLPDDFATRRLGAAALTGIAQPVELYELYSDTWTPRWRSMRDAYEAALDHFQAQRWTEACQAIHEIMTSQGGAYDTPSLQLLARAVECLRTRPEPFDPVMRFQEK